MRREAAISPFSTRSGTSHQARGLCRRCPLGTQAEQAREKRTPRAAHIRRTATSGEGATQFCKRGAVQKQRAYSGDLRTTRIRSGWLISGLVFHSGVRACRAAFSGTAAAASAAAGAGVAATNADAEVAEGEGEAVAAVPSAATAAAPVVAGAAPPLPAAPPARAAPAAASPPAPLLCERAADPRPPPTFDIDSAAVGADVDSPPPPADAAAEPRPDDAAASACDASASSLCAASIAASSSVAISLACVMQRVSAGALISWFPYFLPV